jgi:NAD(P)-dependent dehydrogenase (short-subunit alcohol dehydrogenase family)
VAEDLGFDRRVAVVTGAGGGLGRRYALDLAARGARVVRPGPVARVLGRDAGPAEATLRPAATPEES